jgi:hypothetical protein
MLSLKKTIQPKAGRFRKLILKKIRNFLWQNRNTKWENENALWNEE